MEAEHHLVDISMENEKVFVVVEAVTQVAQAEFGMINLVTEVVEDPLQLIQRQHSITNTKPTENAT